MFSIRFCRGGPPPRKKERAFAIADERDETFTDDLADQDVRHLGCLLIVRLLIIIENRKLYLCQTVHSLQYPDPSPMAFTRLLTQKS